MFELSVIMPALNEAANIENAISHVLSALDDCKINAEIIVINDGSTDDTQALIEKKMKEEPQRLRLIRHDTCRGIGASFWEGLDASKGSFIVMLPGDDENDPEEIFRYFRLLNHVDIVIPFIFNREVRPLFRNVLSFLYRFIINTTFLVNFNYTNGTVLYRRSILEGIDHRSDGFFFQTDILTRSVKKGYLFAEVPYRVKGRKSGVSKAISFPSLWYVVKGYLRLIKEYYFSKKYKASAAGFSKDSLTAVRRKQEESGSGLHG